MSRPFLHLPLSDDEYLRVLEEADADELHAAIETDRDYLSRWMPWPAGQTRDGTLEFIRLTRRQVSDNNGFQLAIVCDGGIRGVVGFHSVDWSNRATSIGYWLSEHMQGRGTMTRAVTALVDHAFSVWKLHRVEIRVAPDNLRSRGDPRTPRLP